MLRDTYPSTSAGLLLDTRTHSRTHVRAQAAGGNEIHLEFIVTRDDVSRPMAVGQIRKLLF